MADKVVVWPANIDTTKSRVQGRRVPKGSAIQNPRLDEINEAAKRISLEAELVPGKSRPGSWWEKGGYAILPKRGSKTQVLRALVGEIRKIRAAKTEQEARNR